MCKLHLTAAAVLALVCVAAAPAKKTPPKKGQAASQPSTRPAITFPVKLGWTLKQVEEVADDHKTIVEVDRGNIEGRRLTITKDGKTETYRVMLRNGVVEGVSGPASKPTTKPAD